MPDDFTLRVQETRPDASIVHIFAMPFTAPIPPLPTDPTATFGVATGHPFAFDYIHPPSEEGYGRFVVATGPYMFDGAPDLDLTLPPDQQVPISGFTPGGTYGEHFTPGQITFVRNPSWDRATDPNRPALADRIDISIVPPDSRPYHMLAAGSVDVVMGENPPTGLVEDYRSAEGLRGQLEETTGNATYFAKVNVAQPPFDDPHVRRALALALDRAALADQISEWAGFDGSLTSHLVPDPMEGSLLASWDPFASMNDAGNEAAARSEMGLSRYEGKCSDRACDDVVVVVEQGGQRTISTLREALARLGIQATFFGPEDTDCYDPAAHVGLCIGLGWRTDFPDAGNMFWPELSSGLDLGINASLVGSTPEQLRSWGYPSRHVPSIDGDYERCAAELGMRAEMCWARLDQRLVGQLVAIIPFLSRSAYRLKGASVLAYSLDQAFGEPSLDRIAATTSPSPAATG
jgi:peptide/nickel transport system substrate-binding protein